MSAASIKLRNLRITLRYCDLRRKVRVGGKPSRHGRVKPTTSKRRRIKNLAINGEHTMKKSLMSGLTAAVIAIAAPVFAADEFWDRLGDRIDQGLDARGVWMDERLDARGDRLNERFDLRGDRRNERLDAKGDRINERLDNLADKAQAEGKTKLAARLDRRGDRIDNHLDRKGDRIEARLDR